MKEETRKRVFNAFKNSNDYDVYLKVLDIMQDEIKQIIITQLSERLAFQTLMMNKLNNAGWDDELTHSKLLDVIRNEGYEILNIADKYRIDQDEI